MKNPNSLNGGAKQQQSMSLTVLLNGRQVRSMQLCDANHNHAHSTGDGHESLDDLDTCNACRAHSVANLESQHQTPTSNGIHRRLSNEFLSLEPLLTNGGENLSSNGRLQREIRRDVRESPEKEKIDDQQDKTKIKEQRIVEVLRQLVRDCTNPDPSKRPSAFEVTERLQPLLKP